MNTNGLLSFERPSSQYSPLQFPLQSQTVPSRGETYKVIAPFWGDVDNTNPGSGQIWYRQTTMNTTLLSRTKQDISEHSLLYPGVDVKDFNPLMLVVITWDHVGYFRYNQGHSDNSKVARSIELCMVPYLTAILIIASTSICPL